MDQLLAIGHGCLLAVLLLVVSVPCSADTICSLKVRVLSPEGHRFSELPVEVRESGGRVIVGKDSAQDIRFCDLGLHPVTVTVGSKGCYQVEVRDLPLEWGEEYLLQVIYDHRPCLDRAHRSWPPLCRTLLRITDEGGVGINGAVVKVEDLTHLRLEADEFGRVLLTHKGTEQVRGTISKSGFIDMPFTTACSPREPQVEKQVVLHRRSAAK